MNTLAVGDFGFRCIPVLIADDIEFPYESELDYSRFALKIREKEVDNIVQLMQVTTATSSPLLSYFATSMLSRENLVCVYNQWEPTGMAHSDGLVKYAQRFWQGLRRLLLPNESIWSVSELTWLVGEVTWYAKDLRLTLCRT
jgi:hypothetical protein